MPIADRAATRAEYQAAYYRENEERLKEYQRQHRAKNRDRILAREKARRAANKEELAARSKQYRESNREKVRARELAHTGFTVALYDRTIADQQGRCVICSVEFDQSSRSAKACADHCHTTGMPRGVLCCSCNLGLGYFKDDPERLQRAAAYLAAPPLALA